MHLQKGGSKTKYRLVVKAVRSLWYSAAKP
jgi:hypothetical protein